MRHVNVFDLETFENNGEVVPYCACFIIENAEYSVYYNASKNIIITCLNIIVEKAEQSYIEIFVHNLNFDGLIILDNITKSKIDFNIRSNKSNIYYLDVIYMNKTIRFRCSYKIIPLSLKKLGEIENFPKMFFPYKFISHKNIDYIGTIPETKYWNDGDLSLFIKSGGAGIYNVRLETIKYCMNDVILLKKVMENIIPLIENEEKNIIKKKYSSASLSHKIFYSKYNFKKIDEKINLDIENYIRKSYYGGRTEVFGNPKEGEHIKYYDFSGMYGQCMLEKFHNGVGRYSVESDYNIPGFHTIEYESNADFIPILPSKGEKGKLLFANGKGVGTYWFEEIILFVENGGIIKRVTSSYIYDKYEEVFTDFVKNFTNIRKKGGYYKIFGKLMINSLYGSMALKSDDFIQYITFSEDEYYSLIEQLNIKNSYHLNSVYILTILKDYKSKKYFKDKKNEELSKRNLSYSSAIASKARIKLFKSIQNVINDGGRLMYCDTDSIFAAYDKKDVRRCFGGEEWLEVYDDAVFISPKAYALKSEKNEIKIKGVRVLDIDFGEIKKKFYNNSRITITDQLIFKKTNLDLKQVYIDKNLDFGFYDKRIFTKDKKNTLPLYIDTVETS